MAPTSQLPTSTAEVELWRPWLSCPTSMARIRSLCSRVVATPRSSLATTAGEEQRSVLATIQPETLSISTAQRPGTARQRPRQFPRRARGCLQAGSAGGPRSRSGGSARRSSRFSSSDAGRFVVHLHATLVNEFSCCQEGRRLVCQQLRQDVIWVDLVDLDCLASAAEGLRAFEGTTGKERPRAVICRTTAWWSAVIRPRRSRRSRVAFRFARRHSCAGERGGVTWYLPGSG